MRGPSQTTLFCVALVSLAAAEFKEEMMLVNLNQEATAIHFQFTTTSKTSTVNGTYLSNDAPEEFPLPIRALAETLAIDEFTLTLSRGQWLERWGNRVHRRNVPSGVSLFASFVDDQHLTKSVDDRWTELKQSLSGLFCSGIAHMNKDTTLSERINVENVFVDTHPSIAQAMMNVTSDPRAIRYGILSFEPVCTENLMPWIRLLPCRDQRGLASWIDSSDAFATPFHELVVHFKRCVSENLTKDVVRPWELTQTFTVVKSGSRWHRDSIPTPCVATVASSIYIDSRVANESDESVMHITPTPSYVDIGSNARFSIAEIDVMSLDSILRSGGLDVEFLQSSKASSRSMPPPISIQRIELGHLTARKRALETRLRNNLRNTTQRAILIDVLPWFLRRRYASIRVRLGGRTLDTKYLWREGGLRISPARHREAPSLLQLSIDIPAQRELSLYFEFSATFRQADDIPPDPNRGFDALYAVCILRPEGPGSKGMPDWRSPLLRDISGKGGMVVVQSSPMVVMLPILDVAMPFNVIALTSTAIAFVLGSIINIVSRPKKQWLVKL